MAKPNSNAADLEQRIKWNAQRRKDVARAARGAARNAKRDTPEGPAYWEGARKEWEEEVRKAEQERRALKTLRRNQPRRGFGRLLGIPKRGKRLIR